MAIQMRGTPNQAYQAKGGVYTADPTGLVTIPSSSPDYVDIQSLLNQGLVYVGGVGAGATFAVTKGHAANYVRITIITAPLNLFLAFVRLALTEGAAWGPLTIQTLSTPGIALAGQADAHADGNAAQITGGRGVIVGVDFTFAQVPGLITESGGVPAKGASGWYMSDVNGFFDLEVHDSSKASFYLTVVTPGQPPSTSRQVLTADYA